MVMVSAAGVIRMRPDTAMALMIGSGLGARGAEIISIALGSVRKTLPGGEDTPPGQFDLDAILARLPYQRATKTGRDPFVLAAD